ADIALAGVDDIPMARFVSPPLTTIRVRMAELGARALERLAAAIDAPDATPASTETVPAELVVRESCGARRAPAPGRPPTRLAAPKRTRKVAIPWWACGRARISWMPVPAPRPRSR